MDWSQFGDFQKLEGNPDDIRKSVSDTMYKQATSRLDPQWQQQQEQTISQLRNQGLKPGDKAYDTAMDNMNRQKTDAYNQANYSSITGGGAEAQREQQMAGTAAGFNNTTRQAQIAEDMQKRGFSLNEINAILSGQQVGMPSAPGFTNAGVAQGVNYSGAAASQYQAATDAANIQNAGMNSLMSGIGGAAGTAAMMSDIKLKRFITYLFTSAGRHFYAWRWVWGGTGTGVLAQENLDIAVPHPSGFLAVDYGRI
jgi:hypothetical protein